jgi:hypothetical protein
MNNYFKTWWHCTKKLLQLKVGHRICYVKYPGKRREYMCECNPEFKEHMKWFEEHYDIV